MEDWRGKKKPTYLSSRSLVLKLPVSITHSVTSAALDGVRMTCVWIYIPDWGWHIRVVAVRLLERHWWSAQGPQNVAESISFAVTSD